MRFSTLTPIGLLCGLLPMVVSVPQVAYAQVNGSNVSRSPLRTLEARLETDRRQYSPRRAVEITMTLTNLADRNHTVATGGAYQYDFQVKDIRTGQAVYTLSKNRPRLPKDGFTIPPGDLRTYQELWDQTDDSGNPVKPGVYTIEARLYPQNTVTTQIFLSNRPVDRPDPTPGDPPTRPMELTTSLTADTTTVAPGGTVNLTYALQNGTNELVSLRFSSSKRFDITAIAPNGVATWQLSQGMSYLQALGMLNLAPQGKQNYTATWQVPQNAAPGRYQLTAYLTPLNAGNRPYLAATTTVVVGTGNGNTGNGNNGVGSGIDGAFNGSVFIQGTSQVSARVLVSPAGSRYIGQKVMMIGKYNGLQGGTGTPPVTKSDWVFGSEGVTLYVTGTMPNVAVGSNLAITGTVRRTPDGRTYLEAK